MIIALDGAVVSAKTDTSVEVTVGNNTNRLLLVCIGTHQSDNATGVTFNGDAMTLIKRQEGSYGEHCDIWGLVAPDVATGNVVVSGADGFWAMGIYSLYNTDQTLPDTFVGEAGDDFQCTDTITTPVDNCLVVGVMSSEALPTLWQPGAESEDWQLQGDSYQNAAGASVELESAGAQVLSWDLSSGSRWQTVLVAVEPVAGSTSPSISPSSSPSASPSVSPSISQSTSPSASPSASSSISPSASQSISLSVSPSISPSPAAGSSASPSISPSASPSASPSVSPSEASSPGDRVTPRTRIKKFQHTSSITYITPRTR